MTLVLAKTWKQFECWWRDNGLDRGSLDFCSVNTIAWHSEVVLLPGWYEGRRPQVVRDISIALRDLECEQYTPERWLELRQKSTTPAR